jgi:hypothetical protein
MKKDDSFANTEALIADLAKDLAPVRPLARPALRSAGWLLGAAAYLGVLSAALFDPGNAIVAADPRLLLPQLAAIVTGVLAATAAFASSVPGYSKRVLLWPSLAAIVWLGTLIGSPDETPAAALAAQHEWLCVAIIVAGGAPLAAALAIMLRRAAPLTPSVTGAFAALAIGTLANVSACVSLPHSDNTITLVWHGGAIFMLVVAGVLGARFVLARRAAWRTPARP